MLVRRNFLKILISSSIPWLTRSVLMSIRQVVPSYHTCQDSTRPSLKISSPTVRKMVRLHRVLKSKRSHVLVPRPSNKPPVSFVFQTLRISWIIQGSTQSPIQRWKPSSSSWLSQTWTTLLRQNWRLLILKKQRKDWDLDRKLSKISLLTFWNQVVTSVMILKHLCFARMFLNSKICQ